MTGKCSQSVQCPSPKFIGNSKHVPPVAQERHT
jgi:hypothetical protein